MTANSQRRLKYLKYILWSNLKKINQRDIPSIQKEKKEFEDNIIHNKIEKKNSKNNSADVKIYRQSKISSSKKTLKKKPTSLKNNLISQSSNKTKMSPVEGYPDFKPKKVIFKNSNKLVDKKLTKNTFYSNSNNNIKYSPNENHLSTKTNGIVSYMKHKELRKKSSKKGSRYSYNQQSNTA